MPSYSYIKHHPDRYDAVCALKDCTMAPIWFDRWAMSMFNRHTRLSLVVSSSNNLAEVIKSNIVLVASVPTCCRRRWDEQMSIICPRWLCRPVFHFSYTLRLLFFRFIKLIRGILYPLRTSCYPLISCIWNYPPESCDDQWSNNHVPTQCFCSLYIFDRQQPNGIWTHLPDEGKASWPSSSQIQYNFRDFHLG